MTGEEWGDCDEAIATEMVNDLIDSTRPVECPRRWFGIGPRRHAFGMWVTIMGAQWRKCLRCGLLEGRAVRRK